MTVVTEGGHIGIRAEAVFAPPHFMRMNGNKPQQVATFVEGALRQAIRTLYAAAVG